MDEFNEYKLKEYDTNRRNWLYKQLNEIEETFESLKEKVDRLIETTDEAEAIHIARTLNDKNLQIQLAHSYFISFQEEVGLITKEEWSSLREKDMEYEDFYLKLKEFNKEELRKRLDETTLIPPKGSDAYCRCKMYDSLSRVEMGRKIKKDLKDEYHDISFSVTTEDSWTPWCNVQIIKAPEEYCKHDNTSMISTEFLNELKCFLEEYQPKMKISVNGYIRGY